MSETNVSTPASSVAAANAVDTSTNPSENTEGSDESEAAPVAEAPKQKQLRKIKYKMDGQEIEEEYDPENEDFMRDQFTKAKVSQKRMQETANLRKQIEEVGQFLAQAKGNPAKLRTLIKELGGDEKEIARMIVEEEIANASKTPEQLEREKLEAELKDLKDKQKKDQEESKVREFERLKQQETLRYDTLIGQAIEKSDLPKTAYVVKKFADYMLVGLQNGLDVTPDDVLPLVREEMFSDLQEMIKSMGADKVEGFIGKDILSQIRKKNVSKARSNPAVSAKQSIKDTGSKSQEKPKDDAPRKTFKDFFGV